MRGLAAALGFIFVVQTTPAGFRQESTEGWFELSVPGGLKTLQTLGIEPTERAFTLTLLARAIHGHQRTLLDQSRANADLATVFAATAAARDAKEVVTIPAPLSPRVWERLLPPVQAKASADLFTRILGNRSALFTMAALATTDRSIRTLFAEDGTLLRWVFQDAAGTLVTVASTLRIEGGRLIPPGGDAASEIWEKLAGAPLAKPAIFLRALLLKDHGRLAWYWDTLAKMDAHRFALAWPGVIPSARLDSALELYASFRDSDPQWNIEMQPYRRGAADAWMVAMLPEIQDGRLTRPAWHWLWTALFSNGVLSREEARRVPQADLVPVSLAWLSRNIVLQASRERRDRYEMFRLAQRSFSWVASSKPGDMTELVMVLSAYRRYRGLLLALERMGIRSIATWSATVEAAQFVDGHSDGNRIDALTSFQGAVSIVERLRHVRLIDVATAERLLVALADTTREQPRVPESVAKWIVQTLTPALPPPARPDKWIGKTAYESTILQALAGPTSTPRRTIEWEGLTYEINYAGAELDRLMAVREQLMSPGLDRAIASNDSADLARAIMTIVYAAALGDPEGPAVLSGDAPARHDFGMRSTALMRDVWSWAPPEERQGDGRPWRAQGALLSLDLAFARLALGRVEEHVMPSEPTLTLNDFSIFARTVVAMVPSELIDDDRDEIAAAIERGRKRLTTAGTGVPALLDLATEVRMSSSTRELLPWIVVHQPEVVPTLFALRDLMWLGKPTVPAARLHRWGMYAYGLDGSHTTAMPPSAAWEDFTGRGDLGQIATQVPDLTLRLAEETAKRKLPALLVPALLAFAVQDYWHDVRARFGDDWPRMTKQAAELTSERVEDYVAALTGRGPLRRP